MSNRPMPPHHELTRIPFAMVAKGYGGVRELPNLPGLWEIVGATVEPNEAAHPDPDSHGTIAVIVAPARVPQ